MSEHAAALAARVQGDRLWADLETLAGFLDEGGSLYTRRAFGVAYEEARGWLRSQMEAANLVTRRDSAGTLVGSRVGRRELPALVTGSHIDTVEGGGRFDGALGVLAALELARVLDEARHTLAHPLEVVDFTAEEPNRYGSSCVGSRAWVGTLDSRLLGLTDDTGEALATAIARAGADAEQIDEARRGPGSIAAYVELHIEQGPVLEREGVDVGVVSGIVGIRRVKATAVGRAAHAGTTPIGARSDALATAAQIVLVVEAEARAAEGELIGTVGRLVAEPNAPNIVPGHVELSLELRSLDESRLDASLARIEEASQAAGAERGVAVSFELLSHLAPAPSDSRVVAALEDGARAAGVPARMMPSWGGHDASQIATIAPVGMLFAPSRNGLSHHADEWTSPEHCELACRSLLAGLVLLDERLAG